jgi:hypothetical protein
MTRAIKLNDVQLILLSTAAQRADGSLLPPPASLGGQSERIRKAIPPLIKRALVEEVVVSDTARSWRTADDQSFGLVISQAGRAAIASDEGEGPPATDIQPAAAQGDGLAAREIAVSPRENSKAALLIELLSRQQGANLLELVDATEWLPHTIRAAMTGLRKKGFSIARSERDGHSCWTIVASGTERPAVSGEGAQ